MAGPYREVLGVSRDPASSREAAIIGACRNLEAAIVEKVRTGGEPPLAEAAGTTQDAVSEAASTLQAAGAWEAAISEAAGTLEAATTGAASGLGAAMMEAGRTLKAAISEAVAPFPGDAAPRGGVWD